MGNTKLFKIKVVNLPRESVQKCGKKEFVTIYTP
jgi:hypothetical protein